MNDPAADIDGDVYVFPRYLAGSTYTGDLALQPLLAHGWDLTHDDLGNVYVTAPDRKIRLGYLPEGDDDGLWRITAYEDRFGPPTWGVSFNDQCPTEFVTAFTTALASAYQEGPGRYLARPDPSDPGLDAFHAIVPLIKRGWKFQHPRWGVIELQTPDSMAGLEFATGRLDPERELTTLEARWYLRGGPKSSGWYATASTNTPTALLRAITESVSDSAPLPRWKDQMLRGLREKAQLVPVTPPPPPVPTPLDVRRTAPRRAPALTTRSVPRWSTTTTPSATLPARSSGPRR